MPISMLVKKICRPGGSGTPQLHPGDPYEAPTPQKAALAKAIGWADYAPVESAALALDGEPVNKPAKRAYKKRAKKVEDDTGAAGAAGAVDDVGDVGFQLPDEPLAEVGDSGEYNTRQMLAKR